ncbi:hypothetical protein FSP39_024030 [Pinctada imbricata]|uniref:Receptor ligand binding region domain-containing protein n=1 Tax=Pinctada imbricata TaxID=66713 RepID=A0AA88Y7U5_PINIB|nr:hypothetical protein FSP39_024030 [Pinctada imbricata]
MRGGQSEREGKEGAEGGREGMKEGGKGEKTEGGRERGREMGGKGAGGEARGLEGERENPCPPPDMVKYWNIPILTCGGMAREFFVYREETFPLLTRLGPSYFNSLAMYFLQMLKHMEWNKIKLLYERNGQDRVMEDLCHFAMSALHYELKDMDPLLQKDVYKLEDNDIDYILTKEVSHDYAGKF